MIAPLYMTARQLLKDYGVGPIGKRRVPSAIVQQLLGYPIESEDVVPVTIYEMPDFRGLFDTGPN